MKRFRKNAIMARDAATIVVGVGAIAIWVATFTGAIITVGVVAKAFDRQD